MKKEKNRGQWGGIAVLIVVGGILGGMFGTGALISEFYSHHLGDDKVWFVTGNLTGVPMILLVLFMAVCIWLFWPYGAFGNLWTGEEGVKARFSGRVKIIITVLALCLMILGVIVSMFWYECYTMDGVEVYRFGQKKEYKWKDADHFTLKSDFHGILVFEVSMKDGRKYGFNGGFWHAAEYGSSAYTERFSDEYGYTVWLAGELARHQVAMDVSDWDRLMKKLMYDSWKELAEEIRAAYEEADV